MHGEIARNKAICPASICICMQLKKRGLCFLTLLNVYTTTLCVLPQSKLYREMKISQTNSKLSTELMLYHMQVSDIVPHSAISELCTVCV